MKIILIIGLALVTSLPSIAQVTDKDGYTYKTVEIGNQEWMSENLNVSHFRNGVPIPEVKTKEEWQVFGDNGMPAWCYYYNNLSNGEKYGKMYNWYAINDPRGLAPEGWHIPSKMEWINLEKYLGASDAGTKMKTLNGWGKNGNGTNESGFSGLPGGNRSTNGEFNVMGCFGEWWSSTSWDNDINKAWSYGMNCYVGGFHRSFTYKDYGLSVRCLKD